MRLSRCLYTYPVETALTTVDSNDLGDGVVLLGGVVDVSELHHGAELDVGGLVDTAVEVLGGGGIAGLSVCLAEEVFTLDSLNVSGVA